MPTSRDHPQRLAPRLGWAAAFCGLLAVAVRLDSREPATEQPERTPAPRRPHQPVSDHRSAAPPAAAKTTPARDTPSPAPRLALRIPRPFEGSYTASLTSAILALAPFIVVTTAYALFTTQVGQDVHASRTALSIIAGLSTAGYAWGALLGGDLVQRFPQRRMFFLAETLFVVGCLLAAIAAAPPVYAAGRVLSGFATGLMLVVALPPVIQRFPARKLKITVVAINIAFFGAVCIGPLLGGWVAAGHHWRWFFGALGALGAANILLAALTLPNQPPFNPGIRLDATALVLGFFGVVLPFWASGELVGHGFAAYRFAVPMGIGLVCFVALLLVEYHRQEPLSPVKLMWNTPSVIGTLVAMIGGGGFVALLELAERFHAQALHQSPLQTGVLFWPLPVAVLIAAGIFGLVLTTRYIPLMILAGMACLIGSAILLLGLSPRAAPALTLASAGLLGLGAGATVSPGLYYAGFPLASQIIGRVFALVELVRSLADYIIAPVVVQIAREASAGPLGTGGIHSGVQIVLWLMVASTVAGTALFLLGRSGLPRPDLERWLGNRGPAIQPVPLLARARPGISG